MTNNRPRDRLSAILSPSTNFAASCTKSHPTALNSVPFSHKEDPQPRQVKRRRQPSYLFSFPPTTSPLLPGLSIMPPSATSWTSGGLAPSMPQSPPQRPPRPENPYAHRSLHRTSRPSTEGTRRPGQVMELPDPKRSSEFSYPHTPESPPQYRGSLRPPRNRAMPQRRASVDVTPTLDRIVRAGGAEPKQVTLSRSRSLWTHKDRPTVIGDDSLREANPPREPLTERQRVMNVRRARKMQQVRTDPSSDLCFLYRGPKILIELLYAQVFGSEPPQELFQAMHPNPRSHGGLGRTVEFDRRASMSTLSSVSTADLLSQRPPARRQRAISAASTITTPTPPLTPISPTLPQPETSTSAPRFEQSFTHNPPTTAPPFSHAFPEDTQTTGATPGTIGTLVRAETTGGRKERDFRQRRMRAAKLSRFFGVGYQDLEPHLAPRSPTNSQKLEVAIDDRGGLFWERHELRSLDMEDVIVKLRDLRSS